MKGDRILVLVTIALPGLVSWENIIGWTCSRGYRRNGAACRGSPSTCASRETELSKEGKNKTRQYWMDSCMIEGAFNKPKLNNLISDILKHFGSKSEWWIFLRRVLSRPLWKKKKKKENCNFFNHKHRCKPSNVSHEQEFQTYSAFTFTWLWENGNTVFIYILYRKNEIILFCQVYKVTSQNKVGGGMKNNTHLQSFTYNFC